MTFSMDWDVRLSNRAKRALEQLPVRDRDRIAAALIEMKSNPRAGDMRPLQGRHRGAFRRRVGSWRVIFAVETESRIVLVADITRRTSTTY
jgi:mRNA-degrading endonuclease RelE of RelBE toxin-antitoxin system